MARARRPGGHTHPAEASPASPGARTKSARPVAAIPAAGTNAHRWGRSVIRIDRTASIAQPSAKPSNAVPVMTYSSAPPNTTKVRTAATTTPVTSDPAMIRRIGPRWNTPSARLESAVLGGRWVGCMAVVMTVPASVSCGDSEGGADEQRWSGGAFRAGAGGHGWGHDEA